MKRHLIGAIILIAAFLSVQAQMPPQQPQMKLEDVQKALSLVDKPQSVPDKYKVGFETITPAGTMAMLAYISSDWMEGRDTAKPGYDQAADYAASLFKMWGIKPAGDMPPVSFGRMRGGTAPARAPERTYLQNITFKETTDVQSSIKTEVAVGPAVKTKTFTAGLDYQGGFGGSAETIAAPVVFVGYGISEPSIGFDELKGLNLKGKIVLVLTEAPGKDNPQSPFQAKKELKDKYFPAGPAGGMQMMMPRGGGPARFNKIAEIQKLGPAAIIQVANTGKDIDIFNSLSFVRKPSDDRPIIVREGGRLTIAGDSGSGMGGRGGGGVTITREIANALLEGTGQTIDDLREKIEKAMKPASMDLSGVKMTLATTARTKLVRSPNVLGMIEGSDPKLKDECFVIGGHFDHLGRAGDYIYNGADDNGSGSVGVLAIAKAMALNPVKPKRTIIFALWTGEEKGLFGSRYYVQNPVFPAEKTIGYLNYDMISRAYDQAALDRSVSRYNVQGAEDIIKKIRPNRFATVSLTADTAFAAITREMNQYVGLDLALRESALGVGSGGSDHASFASVKVPFVYYMAAMTSDYHQPSDSVEKVDAELFTKIVQMG
ncbi:MAG: M20/M25/M40 family metallo-hydrolase, partial [Candidatus Aminicenantes bacterium]|nr:M20/M25/M40 family metallo-hydrolase [Candidatus Aminicenantes bacterium]